MPSQLAGIEAGLEVEKLNLVGGGALDLYWGLNTTTVVTQIHNALIRGRVLHDNRLQIAQVVAQVWLERLGSRSVRVPYARPAPQTTFRPCLERFK